MFTLNTPDDLVDEYFRRHEKQIVVGPLDGIPNIRELFVGLARELFGASYATEEGRPTQLKVFVNVGSYVPHVLFAEPIPFERDAIVRLAPACAGETRALAVGLTISGPLIQGIIDDCFYPHGFENDGSRWSYSSETIPPYVLLTTSQPGHLEVADGHVRVELRGASIASKGALGAVMEFRSWAKHVADTYAHVAKPEIDTVAPWAVFQGVWNRLLREVQRARHGGTFFIRPKSMDDGTLGDLSAKYRLADGAHFLRAFARRVACERHEVFPRADVEGLEPPAAPLTAGDFEELVASERALELATKSLAAMTAVDGAVLLNDVLEVSGFGVRIAVSPTGEEVTRRTFDWHSDRRFKEDSISLSAFGLRHAAAYSFCKVTTGGIAFVVSQDGDLRVFFSTPAGIVLYDGYRPEERSGARHVRG